jgi:hypothetical protein
VILNIKQVARVITNNPGINITPGGLQHVIDRHTYSNIAKYASKSKFNLNENVVVLIQEATQMPMNKQANGNYERIYDAGRNIGIDRTTGQQTSIMTVITKPDGRLVTAFPGRP